VRLIIVHHGDAVGPEVDPRRPLSPWGREAVDRLAAEAASRGVKPAVIWHSGKLRAKETAEAFWRVCNPFAEFSATRDLQPEDQPEWMRDRLRGETRDILIAGHYPHLPRLLTLLLNAGPERPGLRESERPGLREGEPAPFPQHGVVALTTEDAGETWRELWRLSSRDGVGR
jgi:phosphohistidine phosphatase